MWDNNMNRQNSALVLVIILFMSVLVFMTSENTSAEAIRYRAYGVECDDTDPDKNPFERGTVTLTGRRGERVFQDRCRGEEQLQQYVCKRKYGGWIAANSRVNCPDDTICENGACVEEPGFGPFELDENTLGLWHFDEGEDETAFDATDNEYDMEFNDGAAWTEEGQFDGAVDLTEEDAGLFSDWRVGDDLETITVEAWVKIPRWNEHHDNHLGAHGIAIRYDWYQTGAYVFQFGREGRGRGTLFGRIYTDAGAGTTATDDEIIPLNEWTHVAMTWNSGEPIYLWVNGEVVAESEPLNGRIRTTDDPLRFGGGSPTGYDYSNILIDELRISDVVRYE